MQLATPIGGLRRREMCAMREPKRTDRKFDSRWAGDGPG